MDGRRIALAIGANQEIGLEIASQPNGFRKTRDGSRKEIVS